MRPGKNPGYPLSTFHDRNQIEPRNMLCSSRISGDLTFQTGHTTPLVVGPFIGLM